MKALVARIGVAGLAGIALLGAAIAFSTLFVRPLEERGAALAESAARRATPKLAPGAEKVASVYGYLARPEDTTDWLATLHGIGAASGVQLKSATYRTQTTDARIVRFEIVLPAEGSYAQIRDFLKRALGEIPVLSLDSLSLKKNGQALQAEMRLTLHMVKS